MRQRSVTMIGGAGGLMCGVGLVLLCGAAERGDARFQLHVWKTEGAVFPNGNTAFSPDHGAYRLDTQTGEIYEVKADGGMRKIGA